VTRATAKTASRKTSVRKTNAAGRAKVATPTVLPPQPVHLAPFTPGRDYQVANPRLINGRLYQSGEILDQTGLDERHVRLLREQRVIIDIPLGTAPRLPIPGARPVAPLSDAEKTALREPDPTVKGKVAPLHRGFGKWYVVDDNGNPKSGKNVAGPFEGNTPRNDAQRKANEINEANGHEIAMEERELADRDSDDDDDDEE